MRHFDNEVSEGVDYVTRSSKSEMSEMLKYLFFSYLIPSLLTSSKVTLGGDADPYSRSFRIKSYICDLRSWFCIGRANVQNFLGLIMLRYLN